MFMRESGFRRQRLPHQRELVSAVAHIAPAGLDTQSKYRVTGLAGSRSGKRAIEQNTTIAARRVTT